MTSEQVSNSLSEDRITGISQSQVARDKQELMANIRKLGAEVIETDEWDDRQVIQCSDWLIATWCSDWLPGVGLDWILCSKGRIAIHHLIEDNAKTPPVNPYIISCQPIRSQYDIDQSDAWIVECM